MGLRCRPSVGGCPKSQIQLRPESAADRASNRFRNRLRSTLRAHPLKYHKFLAVTPLGALGPLLQ